MPSCSWGWLCARYRRAGLELDQVDHRAVAEQRPALDALGKRERVDVVEADELQTHRDSIALDAADTPSEEAHFPVAIVQGMTALATDLLRDQAYVDGAWIDADSGATFPVVDPATGLTIAEVPRLGAAETRRAIEAAQRALPAWKHRTAKDRARILRRLADLMLERCRRPGSAPRPRAGEAAVRGQGGDRLRSLLLRVVR